MDFEQEIVQIKERNKRVESDKAWEKSWARRLTISIITYFVAASWLITINDSLPWLKSFVPVVGYWLSTLSLPWVKHAWLKKQ